MSGRRRPVEQPAIDTQHAPPPAYSVQAPPSSAPVQSMNTNPFAEPPYPQHQYQQYQQQPQYQPQQYQQQAQPQAQQQTQQQTLPQAQQQQQPYSYYVANIPGNTQPVSAPTPQQQDSLQRRGSQEDRMAILRRFDTMFIMDDSKSMAESDLWKEAKEALMGVAREIVKYDSDGIDIHFLCNPSHEINVRSSERVQQIFQSVLPLGDSTPTEVKVEELLGPYVEACEAAKERRLPLPKPLNVIVITDGNADDPDTLADTIAGFARRLDEIRAPLTQLGIQFVQIGDNAEFAGDLKALDDDLRQTYGLNRDMVDTTPYEGSITADFLLKVALGGINRRIDRS